MHRRYHEFSNEKGCGGWDSLIRMWEGTSVKVMRGETLVQTGVSLCRRSMQCQRP